MPPENRSDEPTEAQPAAVPWWKSPGQAVRSVGGWAAAHRLKAGLLALAAMLSLGGVAVTALVLMRSSQAPVISLDDALQALDRGDMADARRLADEYEQKTPEAEVRKGGPEFVRGAAAAYEADRTVSDAKADHFLIAARHLQQAWHKEFPPGRQAEGLYLLGKSLYCSGQIVASRPVLREALQTNPQRKTEIRYLLAAAYLTDSTPKLSEAEEQNDLALADTHIAPLLRDRLVLQRAQILLAAGKRGACLDVLRQLPADSKQSAEADLLRARILILEARELMADSSKPEQAVAAKRKYQEAIAGLRQAQSADTLATAVTCRAMYLIGVCLKESDDGRAASNQFARLRKLFPDTPEAFAATFEEAELLRKSGRPEAGLNDYRQVLEKVADPDSYSNPWLSLTELRQRTLNAYQDYLDKQLFPACLELAKRLHPLFPKERATELLAENYAAWGHSLLEQAAGVAENKAESLREDGRKRLRQAGAAYMQLARLLVTHRRYPDELWNSVQAYMAGHDYRRAAEVLREYLHNEMRKRHSDALTALGEALLTEGRIDEALQALSECVDLHPRDAAAFRARLLAARARIEKGEYDQAEKLLRDNLTADLLTPASTEWRESLFELGRLLHTQRRYDDAIPRLEEAVVRYPDTPHSLQSAYLAADSYRQIGYAIRAALGQVLVESTRLQRTRQANEALGLALDHFQKLRETLMRRQDKGELGPLEKLMLRNSFFAVGDLLFDLARYDEALKAYSMVINRYQNRPETLEAYVQMANAYVRLDRPAEARSMAEQAKVVLHRMTKETSFAGTTNRTREEWKTLLDRLSLL